MKKWAIFLAFLGISAAAQAAWACSNMGPDKHMGVVQAVDAQGGAFTLVDAETGKPLRFVTSAEQLKKVKANDKAVITFKTEGEKLVAKEIMVR